MAVLPIPIAAVLVLAVSAIYIRKKKSYEELYQEVFDRMLDLSDKDFPDRDATVSIVQNPLSSKYDVERYFEERPERIEAVEKELRKKKEKIDEIDAFFEASAYRYAQRKGFDRLEKELKQAKVRLKTYRVAVCCKAEGGKHSEILIISMTDVREAKEREKERKTGKKEKAGEKESSEIGKKAYNIKRFVDAHERSFDTALSEIKAGRKASHWMWYIFPQIKGLGRSETAEYYAIANLDETRAYLAEPVLAEHMQEICAALLQTKSSDAEEVMGWPDNLKLKSCMTLFMTADPDNEIYRKVLEKFFDGEVDRKTAEMLGR